jgi:uncharacterized membrane protein
MPSKTSLFLIGSLAVNAALLGVVGGRVLSPKPQEPTKAQQMDVARYRPASDVVQAAWAQLPDADRTELRKQLKAQWDAMEPERKLLAEAGKAVHDTALVEPFNESKLRDAVTIFQTREQRLQQSAEDVLISHLGKMPPEARATAAVGLLTPFNARVQRDGRGPGQHKPGERPGQKIGPAEPKPPAATPN